MFSITFSLFRYEQAELIERGLEQMTEQIKTVINSLNASQVGALILSIFTFISFEYLI